MNKKIIISLSVIGVVAAIAIGGTVAYFSDTETSTGNTFTAGSIDLGIDNMSYYNGVAHPGTTWALSYDLDDKLGPGPGGAYLFFNFSDLKPGDWGEDTISLHVNNNDAWVCADVTLTSDAENDITEPESDLQDTAPNGELAEGVYFIWWADDGDNVLEEGEEVIWPNGAMGWLGVGNTYTVAIADSNNNIFTGSEDDPINGCDEPEECTYYIGKAWCFGELEEEPITQDGLGKTGNNGPTVRGAGITCDGEPVTNISQSDSMTADIGFTAIQSRNNADFLCSQLP